MFCRWVLLGIKCCSVLEELIFIFPMKPPPRERREVRPQPCPGWEPLWGQLLPVHTCAAGCVCTCMCCMNVHTLVPVFVFASICTRMLANTGCKHIHTGACTCVIAIQVCNTGVQYRRAFACACNCLHVLATICTHFQCMHVSRLHTCTCNTCMLATRARAFLQTCILATRACPCLHSCTLLQHVHACTLATHARACSHACNMHMSAHLHTPPPHAHAQCTHACGCTPACPQPPAAWSRRPPISGRPLIAAVPPLPPGVNSEAYRGRPGGVARRR